MRGTKRVLFGSAAAILVAGSLAACSPASNDPAADGFKIVTTTTQLTDFATNVAEGTNAEIISLFEPGESVHSFEASAADLEDLRTADVVIYNGMGLEPWLEDTLTSADFKGTKIDASEGFDPSSIHDDHGHGGEEGHEGQDHGAATDGATEDAHDHGTEEGHEGHDHAAGAADDQKIAAATTEEHDHGAEEGHEGHDHGTATEDAHDHGGEEGHEGHDHSHDGPNPHIWTSPDGAVTMVENVSKGLSEADKGNASKYDENSKAYIAKLESLDGWIAENIKAVPEEQRVVATGHDALGYYNEEYHITFVGSVMPSWDDNAEPSAAELDDLIAKIKEHKVPAIFTETQLDPATTEALANEAGIKVYSGEDGLYTDSLGADGSGAESYIKATIHNTKQLLDSWGKTASEVPADIQDA